MKIATVILSMLLSGVFLSCHPDPFEPPYSPADTSAVTGDKYPIEIIWKVPLHPDTADCESMMPVLDEDKVFFSGRHCYGRSETILGLNKNNGNILWKYGNTGHLVMYSFINPVFENNYLIYSPNRIHAINKQTGSANWIFSGEQYDRKVEAWFYRVRDQPVIILGSRDLPWQSFRHLLQLDPKNGSIKDTLVTM